MRFKHLGPIAVVVAALLWSVDGLLRRQLYSAPSSVVVFWEHVLGFAVLLPIVLVTFRSFKGFTKKQWWSIGLVALLSGALGTYFYTAALAKITFIPFSVVVLLQQLQPLFAITAAAILLKEPLSRRFWWLAVIALAAAYFVSFPNLTVNFDTGTGTLVAALFAVGAAACWGASTAFSKYSLKGTSVIHTTAARFALTPFFALGLTFATGSQGSMGALTSTQWWYLIAIVFSTGLVALTVYYFGLQRVPASRSTLLELAWPVSAAITGFFFFDDRLTLTQWLGSLALIVTMVAVARDAERVERMRASGNAKVE